LYKHDRIFVRSNVHPIEQGYYRTVVRYQEAAMGITSAAETKLDARIRPEIAVLRSRTSYPRRAPRRQAHRPALAVVPGGATAGRVAQPAVGATADGAATAGGGVVLDAATARPAAVERPVITPAAPGAANLGAGVVSGAARTAAPSRPVRLTRRGKIVLGALVALAVASLAALIWLAIAGQAQAAGSVGAGGSGAGHSMQRVVVRPGETLWAIAVRADPAADPRAVIAQIIDDNALRGTAIQVGQVLWVPRV
jgi:hypothetical protein